MVEAREFPMVAKFLAKGGTETRLGQAKPGSGETKLDILQAKPESTKKA